MDGSMGTPEISKTQSDNSAEATFRSEIAEKQKVDLVMNMVRGKNALLGGRVAGETEMDDGSSIIIFAKTTSDRVGRFSRVYGVDSKQGPISISGGAGNKKDSSEVDLEAVIQSIKEVGRSWINPVIEAPQNSTMVPLETLADWNKAFDESIQAVLNDPEAMKQIKDQKIAVLDKALAAVSKPIDFDSGLNQQNEAPAIPLGVAQVEPGDEARAAAQDSHDRTIESKHP